MNLGKRVAFESLLGKFSIGVGLREFSRELYAFSTYNAPQYLYRYRSCNSSHSFYDIENGVMTFSSPSTFEDQEDAAVRDAGLADRMAERMIWDEEGLSNLLTMLMDYCDNFDDAAGIACLTDAKDRLYQMGEVVRCLEVQRVLTGVKGLLDPLATTESFRNSLRVACLCENGNSRYMWSTYADGGSGYLIEYDTSKLFNIGGECGRTYLILPVVYTNELPDTLLLAALLRFQEMIERLCGKDAFEEALALTMVNALFFKLRGAFALEEEWRMSIPITESEIQQPFVTRKITPSRLVAGPNMSKNDRGRLYGCAKEKGIFVHDWNEFSAIVF